MHVRTYERTCMHGHLRPTILGRLRRDDLKTKARFGRLLRPLAWKWNGSILERVDSRQISQNVNH